MHKVCPQCQATFDMQFLCPACGIQLLDVPDRSAVIRGAAGEPGLHARSVGRQVLAGIVLAQGLYFALRQTATGLALLGVMPEPDSLVVLVGLQLVAAWAGGLVAGAGNPRGLAAGAAIGVIHASLLIGSQFALGTKPADMFLYGIWLPNVIAAAVGGWLGRRFWPSVHDLPDPSRAVREKKTSAVKNSAPPVPIAWLRVLGGAALAIGCAVWAGRIRDLIIAMSAGAFTLESQLQGQFIAWVITTLAMIIGGAFAGAGSRGGLKHGFLLGLLACIGIFLIHRQVVHEALPAEQFFASIFHLPEGDDLGLMRTILFLLTNTLIVGILAGWFGSMLLPRVGQRRTTPLDDAAI